MNKFLKLKFENYTGLDNIIEEWDDKYKILFEHDLLYTDVKLSDKYSLFKCFNNFANLSLTEKYQLAMLYNSNNQEQKFLDTLLDQFKSDLGTYLKENRK